MCQNVQSQQRKYWNCMRTWQRWKAKKIKRLMRMTKVIQPKMTISRKKILYLYSFFIIIQDADIEDEKVTFLIGQHTDEEENEIPKHRQMIYDNNVQTKKKRRKKKKSKRKHSSFTEQELKVYVQTFAIKFDDFSEWNFTECLKYLDNTICKCNNNIIICFSS